MKTLFELEAQSPKRYRLYGAYREAQEQFSLQYADETLGRLFSFADNTQKPVHRWYSFKEGFASELVGRFINECGIDKDSGLVVDPFSGSGTTALTAQQRGLPAMGIEINPFFVNLASTKLRWYEVEPSSVRPLINEILSTSHSDCGTQVPPELSSFQRLYSQEVLTELLQLKSRILSATYGDDVSRDFLLLGLTAILELTSHAYKTGKGLKFRKRRAIRSVDDVRERVRQRWQDMLFDVEELSHQLRSQRIVLGESRVVQGDARQLPVDDASAALIIYSPPYANTFDYNEVYKLEMWFGEFVTSYKEWRQAKEGSLRSHVSLRIGSQTEGDELLEEALSLIPGQPRGEKEMLRAYFADMGEALAEQCRIAKKGAQVVIIVGNSSYRNVPIATDLILARIASTRGLKVEKIHVGRYLNTSSQQMAIYKSQGDTEARKFIRESAVILRK